jgi:hypothetical protein
VTVGVLISPAKVEQVKFDALTMHVQPQVAAQQKMVDDGSGEVQVSEGQGGQVGEKGVVEPRLDLIQD